MENGKEKGRKMKHFGLTLIVIASLMAIDMADIAMSQEKEGQELIGKKAPDWNNKAWLNSKPINLKDLRGKVLLIRWWTDTCSLCQIRDWS
jgi:hypothetical protein